MIVIALLSPIFEAYSNLVHGTFAITTPLTGLYPAEQTQAVASWVGLGPEAGILDIIVTAVGG